MQRIFIFITLAFITSMQAFTVINQTGEERFLSLQEAYRPTPEQFNGSSFPLAYNKEPITVALAPHSVKEVKLRRNCPVLLIEVLSTEITEDKQTQICRQTCDEPYDYQGDDYTEFTNDWGLVIYSPNDLEDPGFKNFSKHFHYKMTLKQGYGIKALHPKLLELTNETGQLPYALR